MIGAIRGIPLRKIYRKIRSRKKSQFEINRLNNVIIVDRQFYVRREAPLSYRRKNNNKKTNSPSLQYRLQRL
jgi:hypothetical protein